MKQGVVLLLLFSVMQGTVIATGDPIKYAPALAMRCGKATQHRDINTGEWISGERDCITDSEELLDYCKKIYKDLTITNVLLDENTVHIQHWCHVGSSPPCHGRGHPVKPTRCIVGQYSATPLEVDEGCTFHHEIDHLDCFPSAHWRDTAAQLCRAKGKTMLKPSMMKACTKHDTYNGVQFLCCQRPQLSTPKPQKGLKPSALPRSAFVSKHPIVDEVCLQPEEIGDCRGSFPKWFYNSISNECEFFIYGGCGGNANNFDSELECLSRCVPANEEAVDKIIDKSFCGLPSDTGPCRALFRKYYYDAELGECRRFIYGGCDGNQNKFDMQEDCESACAGYKQPVEPPMREEPIILASSNPGPVVPSKTTEFEPVVSSTTTKPTTETSAMTTTETTTTTEQSTTPSASAQPYTEETTLDTEHSVFARFLDGIKKEQQDRRDEALAQFDADIAGLESDAKSQKEMELQETITAIDLEYGVKIISLNKFHMEKMDGMFEQERTSALQNFIDAVKDQKPRVRRVVASLEAYVNVEQKDKTHVIQHYQMAIDEEFDNGTIAELKLRMSEIDVRIGKAKTVLDDHPSILSRIEVEVDEIIANVPETPDFEDDTRSNGEQANANTERCTLPMETGLCRASLEAYYFDSDVDMCKYFSYGGCGGNENRFDTMEDCRNACSGVSRDFDNVDANGVLVSEVVIPKEEDAPYPQPDDDVIDADDEETENENPFDDPSLPDYPADADFSINAKSRIQAASYGSNFYLMLGLTGLVVVVILFAIVAVIRRNHTRPPTKIVVDKPREDRKEELTPEEKQLLALQQNGYENPTYKLLEKQMS